MQIIEPVAGFLLLIGVVMVWMTLGDVSPFYLPGDVFVAGYTCISASVVAFGLGSVCRRLDRLTKNQRN